MNKKINLLRNIYLSVFEFVKIKNKRKAVIFFVDNLLDSYDDTFQREGTREELIDLLDPPKIIRVKNKQEKKEAFKNTLSLYNHAYTTNSIKFFLIFIKYDVVVQKKNVYIFKYLSKYLKYLFEHKEAIEKLSILESKDINERGIVKTKYPTLNEALKPRIAHCEEALKFNPIDSNKTQLKLYNSFKESPIEIDFMYLIIKKFDIKLKVKYQGQEQTILNHRTFLNSATKLNDTHLFISIQIRTVHQRNLFKVPDKEFLKLTNSFLTSFFDEVYISRLSSKNLIQKHTIRSFFNDMAVFTYITEMKLLTKSSQKYL